MSMENSKEKRVTLLDWVLFGGVLLSLLIGILVTLYVGKEEDGVRVRYTVYLPEIRTSCLEETGGVEALIPVGAFVRSENGTAWLGRVVSVSVKEHLRPRVKEEAVVFEADTSRQDLYVTVVGDAKESEGDGLRISGIRIAEGEGGTFRFGAFYASGALVLSVQRAEE